MIPVQQHLLWAADLASAQSTRDLDVTGARRRGDFFHSIVTQTPKWFQEGVSSPLPRVCNTQDSSFQLHVPKLR